MIDALESRTLLTASLNNGVLTLTSIYFPDQFTVTADGTNYTVDIANEGFHALYPETGSGRLTALIVNSNQGGTASRPGDLISISSAVSIPATLNGSVGPDTILAGSGDTSVSATNGADSIVGGSGDDTLHGGNGFSAANGQPAADDTIYGGAGNDQLFGDGSPVVATLGSILLGGAGNDTIQGGSGRDIIDGGSGTNTLDYTDKTGLGVNVVFPNPANPDFIPPSGMNPVMNPISPANFPYLGDGMVIAGPTPGTYVENEHDQLYAGLDALPANAVTYDNITQNEVALISDSTFTNIVTGAGSDLVDVSGTTGVAYNINTGDAIDTILGGPLNDTITSGAGRSTGAGRAGTNDQVNGGDGNDTITGGVDADLLFGGAGNDTIRGLGGDDQLQGDNGADLLDGGAGNDLMIGGDGVQSDPDGNDTLLGGPGGANDADTLQGDGGIDTADYSSRTTNLHIGLDNVHDDGDYNTTTHQSIEDDFVTETTEIVLAGSGNDTLTGGQFTSTLNGAAGNDSLLAGTGSTDFIGGAGKDTLSYASRTTGVSISLDGVANDGSGSDNVGNDIEVLIGGSGADNINGDNDSIALTIIGNDGNDTLTGGAGADTLIGGAGSDQLHGGAGNDTLDGGAGGDVLDGGDGSDLVDYSTRTVAITVTMDGTANDGAAGEGDNVLGTVEQVYGGSGNDSISADASNTTNYRFYGNGGNDTIVGGAGNDYLDAGVGNDSIVGNGGNNTEYGQAGNDTVVGGAANDRLLGGPGNDSVTGAAGDDTLIPGSGTDTLRGGDGNDTVSYYYETRPVYAALDAHSDNGVHASHDFIAADVENLQGGQSRDTLIGNSGNNVLDGMSGNDSITGGAGNDTLLGGNDSDTLDGGDGNDTLDGGLGGDVIIGGAGSDTADYSSRTTAVFVTIDNRVNDGAVGEFDNVSVTVEVILGGSGNDSLVAGGHSMTLTGNAGNDTLVGGKGNDSLTGGAGNDSLLGSGGDDTIQAQDGAADTIDGGTGNNDLIYDNGIDVL